LAIIESYAPADPRHYVWWFPGSPIKIHLDLHVIEGLQNQLGSIGPGLAEQGLLFGKVTDGATEILEFQPIRNRTVGEAIGELSTAAGKRLLVGYYRTEPGEMLRLNEADLALFKQFFGRPYHVFLVIQPSAFAPPNATFFFSRGDNKMAEIPFLEFPLDASLLATEERDRMSRCRQAAELLPAVQSALPPEPPNVPAKGHKLSPKLAAVGALVFLALIATWLGISSFRKQSSQPLWGTSTARPASTANSSPHIGLQARRQDRDLELTWNRESQWVASATSGLISIDDGAAKRQIALDSQQLRGERILYSPTSDQVLIQLTITTPGGAMTESVRAILLPPERAKTAPPEVFQSSSTSVQNRGRSERSQPVPASPVPVSPVPAPSVQTPPKPFNTPQTAKANPASAIPIRNEPPPPNLQAETPATRPLALALSQPSALPQLQQRSTPPSAPAASAPPPPTPAPETRPATAQSTSPAATYHPAIPLTKVAPIFPPNLKTLVFKPVTVAVRVTIDKTGKVLKAEPVPQGNIHQFFITEAVHAAQLWTFQPAQRDNQPVASESVLNFAFRQ